jgi:predicted permease
VASYAALLTAFSTLACGLLPALQAIRESVTPDLHRAPRQRLRKLLVGGQITISLVVLMTGFLFLRNMLLSGIVNPGFDIRNTVRAAVHLPASYQEARRMEQYVDQALRALAALPGVEAAAAARSLPFTDAATRGGRITFPDTGEQIHMRAYWNTVTPAYFQAMAIPLLAGRSFLPAEDSGRRVVVVNSAFARRYLGNRNAVGATFLWGDDEKTPYQVVGVVAGTKNLTLGEADEPQFYEPLRPNNPRVQLVIRSTLPPATQLSAVRRALREVDPAAGAEVQTLRASIGLAFLPSQVGAGLMGAMGLLGLMLAAVGLYGTLSYSVARRGPEIAVRLAIGASPGGVARMVLGDSIKLIGWGSAAGLLIAFFVTAPLAMFLVPGVKPGDPINFAAVVLIFLMTGTAAAIGPARRASSIDPSSAVRAD